MNSKDFNELCAIFERFPSASRRWPAIVLHLIERCDGFIEDFTLNETKTSSHLVLKTGELLQTLPDNAGDSELTDLLAQEFEGLYFNAVGHDCRWNSLTESYTDYKKRIQRFQDMSVIETPHANYTDSYKYISLLLGNNHPLQLGRLQ